MHLVGLHTYYKNMHGAYSVKRPDIFSKISMLQVSPPPLAKAAKILAPINEVEHSSVVRC